MRPAVLVFIAVVTFIPVTSGILPIVAVAGLMSPILIALQSGMEIGRYKKSDISGTRLYCEKCGGKGSGKYCAYKDVNDIKFVCHAYIKIGGECALWNGDDECGPTAECKGVNGADWGECQKKVKFVPHRKLQFSRYFDECPAPCG